MVINQWFKKRRLEWTVVVVAVVVESKCYTYIDKNGTHISVGNCKYGGIGETHSC